MTVEVETLVVVEASIPQEKAVVVEESKKVVVVEEKKKEEDDEDLKAKLVEKSSSYREESNFLSDLKEFERKALGELKEKLEEAIVGNTLFKKQEAKKKEKKEVKKPKEEEEKKPEKVEEGEKKEEEEKTEKEEEKKEEEKKTEKEEEKKEEEEKTENEEEKKEEEEKTEKEEDIVVDKEISLWGVPLLPSKGEESTNVVLLKFLRAREFKVNESFEMLKKTLLWRKETNIDSVLEEEIGVELSPAFHMNGLDREGHPVCYNLYGAFADQELYKKAFGSEESRKQFLRWRVQLMEKGIQKLDLRPGGSASLLQINDLKNSPAPSKKEIRSSMNQVVTLLQDNYPEMVARNIFINVPYWYYAVNALLSPFLTQRTKTKFVVARPARVTETLLKYIPAEQIPVQYGGFKRENDFEFSADDGEVSDLFIKAGSVHTIEIPAEKAGTTLLWDLTVLGWEVSYKEEFVPSDEGSYTVIVQKCRKLSSTDAPIRNTFRANEPGKVVLTIENSSSKKKRVLCRFKTKKTA